MSRNEVVTKNRTVEVVWLPALSVAVTVSSCRPSGSSYMACRVPLAYARPSSVPTTDAMPEVGSTACQDTRTSWLSP